MWFSFSDWDISKKKEEKTKRQPKKKKNKSPPKKTNEYKCFRLSDALVVLIQESVLYV